MNKNISFGNIWWVGSTIAIVIIIFIAFAVTKNAYNNLPVLLTLDTTQAETITKMQALTETQTPTDYDTSLDVEPEPIPPESAPLPDVVESESNTDCNSSISSTLECKTYLFKYVEPLGHFSYTVEFKYPDTWHYVNINDFDTTIYKNLRVTFFSEKEMSGKDEILALDQEEYPQPWIQMSESFVRDHKTSVKQFFKEQLDQKGAEIIYEKEFTSSKLRTHLGESFPPLDMEGIFIKSVLDGKTYISAHTKIDINWILTLDSILNSNISDEEMEGLLFGMAKSIITNWDSYADE